MLFRNGISSLSAQYPVRRRVLPSGINNNLLLKLMLLVLFLSQLTAFLWNVQGTDHRPLQIRSGQSHSDTSAGHRVGPGIDLNSEPGFPFQRQK